MYNHLFSDFIQVQSIGYGEHKLIMGMVQEGWIYKKDIRRLWDEIGVQLLENRITSVNTNWVMILRPVRIKMLGKISEGKG